MDCEKLNDNELVYLCNESNEEALNVLIDKYKPLIITTLKEYLKEYNVVGIEISDLYQEGLLGLIHAINSFDHNKDTLFYTYALKCIKTSIMSLLRQSFRMKNRILNNAYSLDKLIEESNNSYYDLFMDENANPDDLLQREEDRKELISEIKGILSKTENIIFDLKLKGLTNKEISILTDKNIKYVENSLYRINKKYKELIEKY